MKKILFVLALIASVAVNAASLNWTISNVKTPTDSTVAGANYSAYLFFTASGGALHYDTTTVDAVVASITGGTFAGSSITTKTNASGGILNAPTGLSGMDNGDSVSGFAVIFDGDFDAANGGNYIVTAVKSASWTSATGAKALSFGTQANATWTAYGSTPPGGVPEPTSGLLLLVGGAMLALRRKQK